MASILDRYGIKEVADVTFYELDSVGNPTNPVLYLDTLKVSTIEQTAEEATATGGKGNAPLIVWDYGKEITVTLEDALFSAKSLAIMFGNGTVSNYGSGSYLMKTESFVAASTASIDVSATVNAVGWAPLYTGPNGSRYTKVNPKFYTATGATIDASATSAFEKDVTYFCTYDLEVTAGVIEVSASSFPGTYYVTGDTYARSEASGKDEYFQFIIPKAKVQSENTITLEAEGDPSVFNMNLKVLRPKDGIMMKLVKYDIDDPQDAASYTPTIIHNHALLPVNSNSN